MTVRAVVGTALGVVFGLVLCWSGMADPNVIRAALLFEESYMFLVFAAAFATAAGGLRLLRLRERRAVLAGTPLTWSPERVERRHVAGGLIFGAGWGVAAACPGPIAAQVGQGIPWAFFTLAGAALGVYLFQRRVAIETEPRADPAPDPRPEPATARA